jgi:DNA-binding NarL/FixJ family response regulator
VIVTILLADDHHVVRQGLRSLLESQPGFQVIGETGDGLGVLPMVEQLKPQVVILDLMMPGLNGLEVTRQIKDLARVIILSMHDNEAYVIQALKNGAYGYVLKDSTAADLIQAVQMVMEGRRFLSAPFSERSISDYIRKTHTSPLDPYDTLTNREREVLQLVAEGHSTNEIAARLTISARTVEIHRANLMHKLGLHSQAELVRLALRRGLIEG